MQTESRTRFEKAHSKIMSDIEYSYNELIGMLSRLIDIEDVLCMYGEADKVTAVIDTLEQSLIQMRDNIINDE